MSITAELREVAGARGLAWMLASREVRVRYKHTVLGIGWALALPVALMLVFTFLFTRVAKVDAGGLPYPVFVFLGLVPWQLHANILSGAARCLTDQRNLVTKVYFAREALPLSVVLSALVDFAVAMTVLAALMAWYGIAPGPGLALVPVVLAVQLALATGLALVLSAANLLYRDVQYVLQVGLQVWMFASSVVYPIPRTGNLKWLAWLNPMTPILDAWRTCITGAHFGLAPEFGLAALISVVVLVAGWRWFRRMERVFGELA
ncbi:MAG: ABC transporter permease [Planctomycetes bacterium]|nr:ABC transporter permease [Planctomycetota bacterium]